MAERATPATGRLEQLAGQARIALALFLQEVGWHRRDALELAYRKLQESDEVLRLVQAQANQSATVLQEVSDAVSRLVQEVGQALDALDETEDL